jgi:colicin import membrane protein
VFAREQVEAARLAEALAAKEQLEADALAAKKRLEADALEELEKVGETRDAVRAANHARHADAAPVPTQPAPLPESVQAARTPISAQQVEDEQESVRLEAAARLAQAEKTAFAASEAKAEAAVAKAAADDAAIEEADRICAEGLKKPGSGGPVVGDKRPLSTAAADRPRRVGNSKSSKKNI